MVRRVWLLACVLAATLAPAARAAVQVYPVTPNADAYQIVGPALAGAVPVWAEPGGPGVSELFYGGQPVAMTGPPGEIAAISASDQRLAVTRAKDICAGRCVVNGRLYSALLTGPPAGPLAEVTGCGEAGEPTCSDSLRRNCVPEEPWLVGVWGTSFGYIASCPAAFHVADPPAATSWTISAHAIAPVSYPWQMAGQYVMFALDDAGGRGLAVADRATGDVVYRVEGAYRPSLAADGSLAVEVENDDGSSDIQVASPAQPTPRTVLHLGAGQHDDFVLTPGLLAASVDSVGQPSTLEVMDLSGRVLTSIRPYGASRIAFDGRHLAWVSQPCLTASILSWDLQDPASVPGQGRPTCPAPLLRARRRVTRHVRVFGLRMHCPASVSPGCVGSVFAFVRRAGRRIGTLHYSGETFHLHPGDARLDYVVVTAADRRLLRGRRVSIEVVAKAQGAFGVLNASRRVRVRVSR